MLFNYMAYLDFTETRVCPLIFEENGTAKNVLSHGISCNRLASNHNETNFYHQKSCNYSIWQPFPFIFQATLRAGIDLKEAVKLPAGERMNDWLAVHGICFRFS